MSVFHALKIISLNRLCTLNLNESIDIIQMQNDLCGPDFGNFLNVCDKCNVSLTVHRDISVQ